MPIKQCSIHKTRSVETEGCEMFRRHGPAVHSLQHHVKLWSSHLMAPRQSSIYETLELVIGGCSLQLLNSGSRCSASWLVPFLAG